MLRLWIPSSADQAGHKVNLLIHIHVHRYETVLKSMTVWNIIILAISDLLCCHLGPFGSGVSSISEYLHKSIM